MAQQRQFATPTYLVALTLVLVPITDVIMQVLPFRLQDPKWRFGFFGLMSNAMMVPLLGLLIAFTAAQLFDQRVLQRVLGVLSIVIGVLFVGLFVIFALDALQVHNDVKPAAQLAFKVASATAATKALLGIVTLGTFGMAAIRGSRGALRRASQTGVPVIVSAKRSSTALPARPSTPAAEEPMSRPVE
jgi:hypothetical protein